MYRGAEFFFPYPGLTAVWKMMRRMLRLRPMPMASEATRMSKPVSGSLNRRACFDLVSGGSCSIKHTRKAGRKEERKGGITQHDIT
jgi:hypothetical protein